MQKMSNASLAVYLKTPSGSITVTKDGSVTSGVSVHPLTVQVSLQQGTYHLSSNMAGDGALLLPPGDFFTT